MGNSRCVRPDWYGRPHLVLIIPGSDAVHACMVHTGTVSGKQQRLHNTMPQRCATLVLRAKDARWPRLASSMGRPPTTSPRPPVLLHGATCGVRSNQLRDMLPFQVADHNRPSCTAPQLPVSAVRERHDRVGCLREAKLKRWGGEVGTQTSALTNTMFMGLAEVS